MDYITLPAVALGLSMDAFAVAVSGGMADNRGLRPALKMAFLFGLFQAVMPMIGFLLGFGFKDLIADYDHWVAFTLLSFIGINMIRQARSAEDARPQSTDWPRLLLLALATSIDALAVGVGMAFGVDGVNIFMAGICIGLTTFALSLVGAVLGARVGTFLKSRAEIAGGVTLIFIGIKILAEHLGRWFH